MSSENPEKLSFIVRNAEAGFIVTPAAGAMGGMAISGAAIALIGQSKLPAQDQARVDNLSQQVNALQEVQTHSLLPQVADAQIENKIEHKQTAIKGIEAATPPGLSIDASMGVFSSSLLVGAVVGFAIADRALTKLQAHRAKQPAAQPSTQTAAQEQ